MAQPPLPAAALPAGDMMAADPGATTMDDSAGGEDVVVTICANGDGSYTVYAGDEPDTAEEGDMTGDDTGTPAGTGQPADSVGAALKLAMDIMRERESTSGAGADSQLAAGFSADRAPTPVSGLGQKY